MELKYVSKLHYGKNSKKTLNIFCSCSNGLHTIGKYMCVYYIYDIFMYRYILLNHMYQLLEITVLIIS